MSDTSQYTSTELQSAPQHTPSVRGVNFRARARRARIRECKEISGPAHAEPGNPWTRPGHGEFHGHVDECATDIDDCSHDCTNTDGSYTCGCPTGYELDTVEKTCNDIDECVIAPCQNGGECQDGVNQYTCSCASGWDGTH
ncbi:Fibrillin-2 [Branchiostoma belcheri]|nr:Fibrillin-2 [Branchiostoma belcheri]